MHLRYQARTLLASSSRTTCTRCSPLRLMLVNMRRRDGICAAESSTGSATSQDVASTSQQAAGWNFIFDLRERETLWLEQNKARLVSIIARDKLGITQQELEDRLDVLLTLVPTLQDGVASMKPSLLAGLLNAPVDQIVDVIITLKELFPAADVGGMLAKQPALLLQPGTTLRAAAQELRELLQTQHVDQLVAEQPLFMDTACVSEVMRELQVLLNKPLDDVRALLRADPSFLLMAQRGQKWLGQNPDQ